MSTPTLYVVPDDDITIDENAMIRALNRDVDQIAREARDKGRIEGTIAMALFVAIGFTAASIWPL